MYKTVLNLLNYFQMNLYDMKILFVYFFPTIYNIFYRNHGILGKAKIAAENKRKLFESSEHV